MGSGMTKKQSDWLGSVAVLACLVVSVVSLLAGDYDRAITFAVVAIVLAELGSAQDYIGRMVDLHILTTARLQHKAPREDEQ